MSDPYFFGYGSLVNRATHVYAKAHRATLHGWRRTWRHTALRPVAFLTAVPAPGAEIDGLIASVPNADWLALDDREAAYTRVRAVELVHPLPDPPEVQLYWIPEDAHGPAGVAHPIRLSYLDVVVQGYLREFGEDGVTRFFDTTDGWDAPVDDDRDLPAYPRAQILTPEERRLVDRHLAARIGVHVV